MFDNQRMKNTNANNTSQSTNNVSTDEDGKKITKTTTLKPVKGGLSQLFEKQRQKNTSKKTTNVESNSNDDGSTKDSAKETACVTKNEKNASKETSKQVSGQLYRPFWTHLELYLLITNCTVGYVH